MRKLVKKVVIGYKISFCLRIYCDYSDFWKFIFHKVVQRRNWGVVVYLENRSIFGENMDKSLRLKFFGHPVYSYDLVTTLLQIFHRTCRWKKWKSVNMATIWTKVCGLLGLFVNYWYKSRVGTFPYNAPNTYENHTIIFVPARVVIFFFLSYLWRGPLNDDDKMKR